MAASSHRANSLPTRFSLSLRIHNAVQPWGKNPHRPRRVPVHDSGNEVATSTSGCLLAASSLLVDREPWLAEPVRAQKDAHQLYLHRILVSSCDWCEVKALALGVTEYGSLLASTRLT